MEYIRQRRPPRHALSPITNRKRRKESESESDNGQTTSCSAFADTSACKECLGSNEYVKILTKTLEDVFQQNQALLRRSRELELDIANLHIASRSKQKLIKSIKNAINSYSH